MEKQIDVVTAFEQFINGGSTVINLLKNWGGFCILNDKVMAMVHPTINAPVRIRFELVDDKWVEEQIDFDGDESAYTSKIGLEEDVVSYIKWLNEKLFNVPLLPVDPRELRSYVFHSDSSVENDQREDVLILLKVGEGRYLNIQVNEQFVEVDVNTLLYPHVEGRGLLMYPIFLKENGEEIR